MPKFYEVLLQENYQNSETDSTIVCQLILYIPSNHREILPQFRNSLVYLFDSRLDKDWGNSDVIEVDGYEYNAKAIYLTAKTIDELREYVEQQKTKIVEKISDIMYDNYKHQNNNMTKLFFREDGFIIQYRGPGKNLYGEE